MNEDTRGASLRLLATRRFLPLFVVQFLGALNDNLFRSAILMLVAFRLAETQGYSAPFISSLGAGLFILPFFLFSATAGAVADRFEKTRLAKLLKGVELLMMIGAGISLCLENVTLMLSMLFLLGVQAAFFGPVKYSILPRLVAPQELVAANGWVEGGTFLAILFGTIAGGGLVVLANGTYMVAIVISLVSLCGWVISYAIPRTGEGDATLKVDWFFLRPIWPLLRTATQNRPVYHAILGISWFWFVGLIFLSVMPSYVKDVIKGEPKLVNIMLGLFSLGIGVGSVACARFLKGRIHTRYVPIGAIVMSFSIVIIYWLSLHYADAAHPLTVAEFFFDIQGCLIAIALFLLAAAGGVFTVPLYVVLQARSEESHRARMVAANNVVNSLFMVASSIFTAAMFKFGFNIPDVFLALLVASLVVVYATHRAFSRHSIVS